MIQPIRFLSAVPQFAVPDVVRTAEYYRDVLGFTIAGYWDGARVSMTTNPPPVFCIVFRDDVRVHFGRAESPILDADPGPGYHAYFHVTGVDALAEELRGRGADLDGPEVMSYGQREVVVRDCNGLILAFGEDTSGGVT